ncbi:MAG TPA: hypothetical protein VLA98_10285 [Solirubrobacteraceae bacterium]|nr:hypothetical protein [Solirubrobacteraceae bacterium]
MSDQEPRPTPLLGSIALEAVEHVEHVLDAGFVATPIAGLDGELQQRAARGSHRVRLRGRLFGEGAKDALGELQAAAADGAEIAFAADITTALDVQHVVIESLRAAEAAGEPGTWRYDLVVAESPPLPPPAELSPFGGLGDFGLGDLGVDLGVLDDIAGAAGELAGVVDQALAVVDQLSSLADLGSLGSLGGLLEPLGRQAGGVRSAGGDLGDAARAAQGALG